MPLRLEETAGGRILIIHASGKLEKQDYERFAPEVERLIREHGKVRVLLELSDFHGWTAGALWQDVKFDVKHFKDIERLAIVAETKWEKGMAQFCRPFTTAQVRYFEHGQADAARRWIEEGVAVSTPVPSQPRMA
jgi:hypothetical protein